MNDEDYPYLMDQMQEMKQSFDALGKTSVKASLEFEKGLRLVKQIEEGQLWIGALTVLSWFIFIGFSVIIQDCNNGSAVVTEQAEDVINSLRKLPGGIK